MRPSVCVSIRGQESKFSRLCSELLTMCVIFYLAPILCVWIPQHIHTTKYSVFHLPLEEKACSRKLYWATANLSWSNMYVLTTTLQASSTLRFISNFWRRNPNFIGWAAYISSWVFLSQHALFFRNKFSVLYWLKLKTLDKTFLYYQHLTFKRFLILISPCNDLRLF